MARAPVPLVTLDPATEELITCNVCMHPMLQSDPLVLSECGHTLCRKCVEAITQKTQNPQSFNCPFCRRENPSAKINVNYNVRNFIEKIQCACGEGDIGCAWTGRATEYTDHAEKK
jgi:hypothetical protein